MSTRACTASISDTISKDMQPETNTPNTAPTAAVVDVVTPPEPKSDMAVPPEDSAPKSATADVALQPEVAVESVADSTPKVRQPRAQKIAICVAVALFVALAALAYYAYSKGN